MFYVHLSCGRLNWKVQSLCKDETITCPMLLEILQFSNLCEMIHRSMYICVCLCVFMCVHVLCNILVQISCDEIELMSNVHIILYTIAIDNLPPKVSKALSKSFFINSYSWVVLTLDAGHSWVWESKCAYMHIHVLIFVAVIVILQI